MKKNETKRNTSKRNLLLVALLLLVAVFTFGGYTLSKYISTESSDSSATVAKWGFNVSATDNELFGTGYSSKDGTIATVDNESGAAVKVSAESGDALLVAPGTKGAMSFTVSGKAEVASKLSIDFTGSQDIKLVKGSELTYLPILWSAEITGVDGASVESARELSVLGENINTALSNAGLTAIDVNKDVNVTITISWEWKLTNDESAYDKGSSSVLSVDECDTALSLFAQGTTGDFAGSNANLVFKSKLSVKQYIPNSN